MSRRSLLAPATLVTALIAALAAPMASAQEKVLNIYSARHYQTDEALYSNFTKTTGIKLNRIDGKEDELVERIRNEGASSPADILITVDATRLQIADQLGLFQTVQSKTLEQRIPAHLRTATWYSFSTRARVIVYNKVAVKREQVQKPGPRGWWPTLPVRPKAAIPTRSRPWRPVNAAWPCPTATTWRA